MGNIYIYVCIIWVTCVHYIYMYEYCISYNKYALLNRLTLRDTYMCICLKDVFTVIKEFF